MTGRGDVRVVACELGLSGNDPRRRREDGKWLDVNAWPGRSGALRGELRG